jgi:hypothetical protein
MDQPESSEAPKIARTEGEKTGQLTRAEIQLIKKKLRQATKTGDYEVFRDALINDLGIRPGSERFRSLEAEFWKAVADYRKLETQKP